LPLPGNLPFLCPLKEAGSVKESSDTIYEPTWKFNATGQSVLLTSLEQELALAGEWADTPAAFGIITHPEAPVSQGQVPMPVPMNAPPPGPPPAWQQRLANLEALVQAQDADLRTMGTQVQALIAQVEALEQHATEAQATAAAAVPKAAKKD
jgi:hypothetical protein